MCYGGKSGGGGRSGENALSRLGVLWGLAALVTVLTAFVSSSWLYTREPVTLPNSDITTTVAFRIGLWRICPSIRRINSTIREYHTTRLRGLVLLSRRALRHSGRPVAAVKPPA